MRLVLRYLHLSPTVISAQTLEETLSWPNLSETLEFLQQVFPASIGSGWLNQEVLRTSELCLNKNNIASQQKDNRKEVNLARNLTVLETNSDLAIGQAFAGGDVPLLCSLTRPDYPKFH